MSGRSPGQKSILTTGLQPSPRELQVSPTRTLPPAPFTSSLNASQLLSQTTRELQLSRVRCCHTNRVILSRRAHVTIIAKQRGGVRLQWRTMLSGPEKIKLAAKKCHLRTKRQGRVSEQPVLGASLQTVVVREPSLPRKEHTRSQGTLADSALSLTHTLRLAAGTYLRALRVCLVIPPLQSVSVLCKRICNQERMACPRCHGNHSVIGINILS